MDCPPSIPHPSNPPGKFEQCGEDPGDLHLPGADGTGGPEKETGGPEKEQFDIRSPGATQGAPDGPHCSTPMEAANPHPTPLLPWMPKTTY